MTGTQDRTAEPGERTQPEPGNAALGETAPPDGEGGLTQGVGSPDRILGGSYRLVARLGVGGMGEVWRAEHLRTGGALAVKLVLEHLLRSPRARQRFELEARCTAALHHPNIVRVFDYGCDQGVLYQVMELVPGCSLQALLEERGALPWPRAAGIIEQVLMALMAAHGGRRGVIHRDIKPANILLTDHAGQQDVVKVVDFGIARALAEGAEDDERHMVGTPLTMAPEQWEGRPVSPATDLYAVGCVTFMILTGRPPFEGTLTRLALAHATEEPPPLGALAGPLGPWVGWLLRKHPHERPESAAAALEGLRAALRGSTSPVVTPGSVEGATQAARTPRRQVLLPARMSAFFGRERERATLDGLLAAGARLLTILGMGGLGKTRLAVEWAGGRAEEFSGGVFFCDLSEAHDAQESCATLARLLGVPLGVSDPVVTLGHALAGHGRALVILDNVEQIVEPTGALVRAWLERATQLVVLVTSRQSLGVAGERVLELPPLATPAEIASVDVAAPNPAVALFVDRARAVRPTFALTEQNAKAVAELVARLDGLPLAIELAATRARVMDPATMLSHLSARFQLLRGASPDLPRRHATLRAVLDGSWELLAPVERAALAQCAVFPGSFGLEAAEVVLDLEAREGAEAPWIVDVLDGLLARSLLQRVEVGELGVERYNMFASVREYAAERLGDAASGLGREEEEAARRRHMAFFAAYGAPAFLERARDAHGAMVELDEERDNLRGALRFAVATGDPERATALALALAALFEHQGPYRAGLDIVQSVLALPNIADFGEQWLLHRSVSRMAWASGDAQLAEAAAEEVRSAARERCDRGMEGLAWLDLGLAAKLRGDFDLAAERLDRALDLARMARDRGLEARVFDAMGLLARDRGRIQEALELHAASLTFYIQAGQRGLEGSCRYYLGHTLKALGRPAEAEEHFVAALALSRALRDRAREGYTLYGLGHIARDRADLASARAHFQASVDTARAIGNNTLLGVALYGLGIVLGDLGALSEAERAQRDALEVARLIGSIPMEAFVCDGLGHTLRDQGRYAEAAASFQACLAIAERLGDVYQQGWTLFGLGTVEASGDALERALHIAQEQGISDLAAEIALAEAHRALDQQAPQRAADALKRAAEVLRSGDWPLLELDHDALAARACAALGDAEGATRWLERAEARLQLLGLGPGARLARGVDVARSTCRGPF